MDVQLINILASKLGITSKMVILRAQEIKRLVDLRARSCSAFSITESCQAVICLDVASDEARMSFNRELAVRLSGMRKKLYTNAVQIYTKLLGTGSSSRISVADVARQFGCSRIADIAQALLDRYERFVSFRLSANGSEVYDFSQAKFAAAAVYLACKKMKLKISKRRLMDVGKVPQVMFDRLCKDMEKQFNISTDAKEQKGSIMPKSFIEFVQESVNENSKLAKGTDSSSDDESSGYNYKEWRNRILNEES